MHALAALVDHTPLRVWAILAVLLSLGWRQTRPREMSRGRLVLLPVAMGAWSLWSALGAYAHLDPARVMAAWAAGTLLGLALNGWLSLPREARALGDGRYLVGGSVAPLLLMLAVFVARYANAVVLALQPARAADPIYATCGALVFAVPAGLLAARSMRVLSLAATAPRGLPADAR